jgi:hypothetical protein
MTWLVVVLVAGLVLMLPNIVMAILALLVGRW